MPKRNPTNTEYDLFFEPPRAKHNMREMEEKSV